MKDKEHPTVFEKLAGKQKRQRFDADGVNVSIEVSPWYVTTNSGLKEGILTTAYAIQKSGYGVKGEAVCIPDDKFDFRFGAELALENALAVKATHNHRYQKIVKCETRKAIWTEFNRVLPK